MTTHEEALEAAARVKADLLKDLGLDANSSVAHANGSKMPLWQAELEDTASIVSAYLAALTPPDVASQRCDDALFSSIGLLRALGRSDQTVHVAISELEYVRQFVSALTHLAAENALLREREGWKPIETAPTNGTKIQVWAEGYEWPEVIFYEFYDDESAAEVGELGYWRYAEDLIAEVTDALDISELTHWRSLPASPSHQEQNNG